MPEAIIFDAFRTPIGRYGGALSDVRTDDLAAIPLKALMQWNDNVEWQMLDDVILGCANQAGEDNRNVARMAALLAGLPVEVPACTVNRLCGSGMDAIAVAARAIKSGEAQLMIAGGVESMSRAPLVMPKATTAFSRDTRLYDTTLGWRFVNPLLEQQYGVDTMPETAENVASQFNINREDQDAYALRSQQRSAAANEDGFFDDEIVPVSIPQRKAAPVIVSRDEHPRADTSLAALSALPTPFKQDGTVTAGNASGINDGACAMLIGNEAIGERFGLIPMGRIVASKTVGVEPQIMGFGPAPACEKLLISTGLKLADMDVIEINEAFAAQVLAVTRHLGLADDAPQVNPNGGAIALGHPLGMSGARIVTTALRQLKRQQGRFALCTMCIGVGQGIAMIVERLDSKH